MPNYSQLISVSQLSTRDSAPDVESTAHWNSHTSPTHLYLSVVVCLRCLLHHILSLIAYTFRENRDFVFIITVQFMMSANIWIRFGLQIVFVCLYITPSHYHHCANLSEDIELIRYILSSVWVRLNIFSKLSIIQYMGLCVFSLPISLVMIERIYTLSYYHRQIGSMIHCLGLGHETMVCAVCFSIFLLNMFPFIFTSSCSNWPTFWSMATQVH